MHTVLETSAYLMSAEDIGMTEEERAAIVGFLSANPQAGVVMPGCGGARKLRMARPGGGKSGGYRAITYYGGEDTPVCLLSVFSKTEKISLSQNERNALAALVKILRNSFINGVTR